MYAYRSRWDGVSIRLNVEIQNEYLYYDRYLAYTPFFNMHQTCHVTYMNMHVTKSKYS